MSLKCPLCKEEIDENDENVFNHLFYHHSEASTTELLAATLESLSEMNIDSYCFTNRDGRK